MRKRVRNMKFINRFVRLEVFFDDLISATITHTQQLIYKNKTHLAHELQMGTELFKGQGQTS